MNFQYPSNLSFDNNDTKVLRWGFTGGLYRFSQRFIIPDYNQAFNPILQLYVDGTNPMIPNLKMTTQGDVINDTTDDIFINSMIVCFMADSGETHVQAASYSGQIHWEPKIVGMYNFGHIPLASDMNGIAVNGNNDVNPNNACFVRHRQELHIKGNVHCERFKISKISGDGAPEHKMLIHFFS